MNGHLCSCVHYATCLCRKWSREPRDVIAASYLYIICPSEIDFINLICCATVCCSSITRMTDLTLPTIRILRMIINLKI